MAPSLYLWLNDKKNISSKYKHYFQNIDWQIIQWFVSKNWKENYVNINFSNLLIPKQKVIIFSDSVYFLLLYTIIVSIPKYIRI